MRVNDPVTGVGVSQPLFLCFTPAGRTWYDDTSGSPPGTFVNTLAQACSGQPNCVGAITVDVTVGSFPSSATGATSSANLIRTVWIPPSGATRITSQ